MPPTGSWAAPQPRPAWGCLTSSCSRQGHAHAASAHNTCGRVVWRASLTSAPQARQRPSSPRRRADSLRHCARSEATRDEGCCLLVLDARTHAHACLHSLFPPLARGEPQQQQQYQQPSPDEGASAFNFALREAMQKLSEIFSIDLKCRECFRLGQILCGNVFVRARRRQPLGGAGCGGGGGGGDTLWK